MFKLRKHQEDALKSITNMTTDKGRIVIPTGGGKTVVEAYALRDMINLDGREIHLVLAPRITLVNQLIQEYRKAIGQNWLAIAFHSGKHEIGYNKAYKLRLSETSTTNIDVLDETYKKSLAQGKDFVVFSTYASAHKLLGYKFDTLIADESQYCVNEDTFETVNEIDATRKLFFTATEKHTSTTKGRGLNNEDTFGPVLYQVAPKTLIKKGYIVSPRLHVLSASAKSDEYTVIDEVIHIASKQIELTLAEQPDIPVSKILFAMNGTNDVKEVIDNVANIKAVMPKHTIFTIVSNNKYGAMVDGVKMDRAHFMKELREADDALIFHYDILSEGIDVDGITGVAILRNMQHAKLLQTIGRAVRIYKANPAAKKFCWVSVTQLNDDDESFNYVAGVLRMIREGGFEVNVEDVRFTSEEGSGLGDEDDLDALIEPDTNKSKQAKLSAIEHNIETLEVIEDTRTLSDDAKLLTIMESA